MMTEFPMREAFRPSFHFTPQRNWMNDPNGLVWFAGEYHLFYQYNPDGDQWGHMSWGHAVSRDLVAWTELPLAIPEDERHWIFSGSIVVDWANTSGFGDGAAPPLVALYTGAERGDDAMQSQCIAYSHDRGRSWTKYGGNPVLDVGLGDFRDPKVFWHAASGRWIMVVAMSLASRIALYGSDNLRQWQHLSDIGPAGPTGSVWECPDLFELPVEGEGGTRWVLKFDVMRSDEPGIAVPVVLTGSFDGTAFAPDADAGGIPHWQRADHGHDFYAAISWSDIPASDGRRVWIGWMSNHHYAAAVPTSPWRGAMTIPRALSLRRIDDVYRLVQQPVAELQARRRTLHEPRAITLPATQTLRLVAPTDLPLACEFHVRVHERSVASFTIGLDNRHGHHLEIGWDCTNARLRIDRSAGLMAGNSVFAAPCSASLAAAGPLTLQIFVDRGSIEIFADDGATVITAQHLMPDDGWSATIARRENTQDFAELGVWLL